MSTIGFLSHLPLVFLAIYAILELLPLKGHGQKAYWFHLKSFFLLVGTILGLSCLWFEHWKKMYWEFPEKFGLIGYMQFHGFKYVVAIFGFISLLYLLEYLKRMAPDFVKKADRLQAVGSFIRWVFGAQKKLVGKPWIVIWALIGLIVMCVIASTGGIIAHRMDGESVWDFIVKCVQW